jgi:hypothetical protein
VTAPAHMVCDECHELIPLDELGFNYEHDCLNPRDSMGPWRTDRSLSLP